PKLLLPHPRSEADLCQALPGLRFKPFLPKGAPEYSLSPAVRLVSLPLRGRAKRLSARIQRQTAGARPLECHPGFAEGQDFRSGLRLRFKRQKRFRRNFHAGAGEGLEYPEAAHRFHELSPGKKRKPSRISKEDPSLLQALPPGRHSLRGEPASSRGAGGHKG